MHRRVKKNESREFNGLCHFDKYRNDMISDRGAGPAVRAINDPSRWGTTVTMHLTRPPRLRRLRRFVERLWVVRAAPGHAVELVLPSGRMQLLVNLAGGGLGDFDLSGAPLSRTGALALQGPTIAPRMLDARRQAAICGVSFRPGGAAFLAGAAPELTDRVVDLDHFWPGCAGRLFDRLCGEADPHRLLDRLERALAWRLGGVAPDAAFARAAAMLGHGHRVADVQAALDLSPHRLRRLFREQTGVAPKQFARIERFRRLVRRLPGRASWAELALELGYVDQAHMIREFRAFSGTSPARYRAVAPDMPTHYRPPAG